MISCPSWRCLLLHRRRDEGHVGVARLAQRRRNADVDHVHLGELREVRRRREAPRIALDVERFGGHVTDIGTTGVERLDLGQVDVEAGHPEARLSELDRQGQSDITQTDHTDMRIPCVDAAAQIFELTHGCVLYSMTGRARFEEGVAGEREKETPRGSVEARLPPSCLRLADRRGRNSARRALPAKILREIQITRPERQRRRDRE